MLKICTKCGEEKPATLEFFAKRDNGLRAACRVCMKAQRKERYEENKEEILQRNRDYHKQNVEKVAEIRRSYYKENKEKIREWQKQYNEENREAILQNKKRYYFENTENIAERNRKYWHENKEKITQRSKMYQIKNAEKIKQQRKEYYERVGRIKSREEYRNNINRKLSCCLRARINSALNRIRKSVLNSDSKKIKIKKSGSLFELIGCDLEFLKNHFEKQFDENMNWANYGSYWHCDHIRPCASFDLTDPEQQKICFHWTNLQPLEAKENMSKGAKWSS